MVNFNGASEVVKSDAVLASLVERSAQRWVPGVSGSAPFVPGVVVRADPVSAAVSAALPASLVGNRSSPAPLVPQGIAGDGGSRFQRKKRFRRLFDGAPAMLSATEFASVHACLRRVIPQGNVSLLASVASKGADASYCGLQRCGSAWVCIECATRLQAEREALVAEAMAKHRALGRDVVMMTLTMRHRRWDALLSTRKLLQKAYERLVENWLRHAKGRYRLDVLVTLKALEVMHSLANGWHPHLHVAWFLNGKYDAALMARFEAELQEAWVECCQYVGARLPSRERGATVQQLHNAARYVAKWGAAAEVVGGVVKTGRNGSRSPWLILESALGGSEPDAVLWREYAQGTKGARQLTGLSPLARLYEVEAAEVEARELVRVAISQEDWGRVLKYQQRWALLDVFSAAVAAGDDAASAVERRLMLLREMEELEAIVGGDGHSDGLSDDG